MQMVTKSDLDAFCAKLNAMLVAYYAKTYKVVGAPTITAQTGTKYAKLVSKNAGDTYGSVYAFVDLATGNLLKAASWKAPAKGVRGNLFNPDPLAGCTPYGMVYFK